MSVVVRRDVRVPTREHGVTLSADLFLPAHGERAPALLTVWPYRKDTGMGEPVLRWFAEQGYAAVLVDARGTGSSDGELRPPFDASEGDDAVDAIQWAADQPWCDGAVGMWGHSYGAIMSLRAAARRPAALRAIVPYQCVADPERELWHPDGARGGITLLSWGSLTLCQHLLPPLGSDGDTDEMQRWKQRLHIETPWLVDLWRNAPGSPVWRERAIDVTSIDVPTLVVGGWRDLMCAGTIRAFEAIRARKRLVMGPWAHELPLGDIGFLMLVRRWFDRWLRGMDDGGADESDASVYVQGAEPGWCAFDAWTPNGATVAIDGPTVAAAAPDPTVGALSGSWWLGHPGITLDQHDDDTRSTHATSTPVDDDLLIVGRPKVSFSLSGESERLVVRIADVDLDGRSTFVSSGISTAPAADEPLTIELAPTAYRVGRGHQLRVVVTDADFPRLWPTVPAAAFAVTDVFLTVPHVDGSARPSDLELPAASAVAPPGRRWTISRDVLHGDVEIVLGETVVTQTAGGHGVTLHQSVQSTVDRDARAVMSAQHEATVRTPSGSTVDVIVSSTMTERTLRMSARVSADGDVLLDRTWEE